MDNNTGGEREDYTDMPGHFYYSGADSEYQGRQDVKYVTVQPDVNQIGDFAFDQCKNLKRIKLSSSVTSIGMAAFQHCESLEKLSIPPLVTFIGGGAFQWCRSLKTLSIPPRVYLIGRQAFLGCTSSPNALHPPERRHRRYQCLLPCGVDVFFRSRLPRPLVVVRPCRLSFRRVRTAATPLALHPAPLRRPLVRRTASRAC